MKAYVSDTEDLKQDPSYQETWDDMIIDVSLSEFIFIQMIYVPLSIGIFWLNS